MLATAADRVVCERASEQHLDKLVLHVLHVVILYTNNGAVYTDLPEQLVLALRSMSQLLSSPSCPIYHHCTLLCRTPSHLLLLLMLLL
jgi:hypothetical protein